MGRKDKYFPYLEKKCGKKVKWKKIQLQFSKSGVFWEKKCSANFLKLRSKLVYRAKIHRIWPKKIKNFSKWTKIQLQLSKSGVFWLKKIFRKFLDTPVIISL